MSNYDDQYKDIGRNILEHGFFDENRTGISTYKLPHQVMQFDLEKDFPILTAKRVAFMTAAKEMMWIYQKQSNDVRELQKVNVKVWDEWMREDGTIGESYGFVVKKYNQMDDLLDKLINNPYDRRMMINLWQIPHIPECSLPPCCFLTMFDVAFGKLNTMLVQRSADWGLGVPFNSAQFALMQCMLAQHAGLGRGLFTHVINNAHIYENQIPAFEELMSRPTFESPTLWLNPDVKDFYSFTTEDFKLLNYENAGNLEMGDVAV